VGDKKISYEDFFEEDEQMLELYRRQYGERLTEDTLKKLNLKQVAVDNLISQAIILQKAKELKIEVSNEEVQNAILSYPAFQRNGVFDKRAYQQALREIRMAPEVFEKTQKSGMTIAKLEALMKESVKVSDAEAFDIYRIQNEKTSVSFFKVSCQNLSTRIKPSNEDLEKFLAKHGESFRIPEQVQVKYLRFRSEDYADAVKFSDDEVNDYYNLHRDSFKKKDGEKSSLAEAKEKIVTAVRQSKAMELAQTEAKKARNVIYQEENLEAYAKQNNLTVYAPESFTKNNLPQELASIRELGQYLSNLKPNQITPVLSTQGGFFIVKLISQKSSYIPKLAEIKHDVEKQYAQTEGQLLCLKEADELLTRLKKGADMNEVAREKGLKIDDTGFFAPSADIPKIGASRDIGMAIYQLSAKIPYADQPFFIDDQYVIIRFKDRKLDEKDFEANKTGLRQFLIRLKENLYFRSWIAETRDAMDKEGKIKSEDAAKL
jgi:peptidyl-prolyl cis-trans isomerase D